MAEEYEGEDAKLLREIAYRIENDNMAHRGEFVKLLKEIADELTPLREENLALKATLNSQSIHEVDLRKRIVALETALQAFVELTFTNTIQCESWHVDSMFAYLNAEYNANALLEVKEGG